LAVLGIAAWRFAYATIIVQPAFRQKILIVGAGPAGRTLAQVLSPPLGQADARTDRSRSRTARAGRARCADADHCFGTGYAVLGFVDDDPSTQGAQIEGIPVLGGHRDLVRLVRTLRPSELVVTLPDLGAAHGEFFQAILHCWELGVRVRTMPEIYERLTGRVPVEEAERDISVILPGDQGPAHRAYAGLRRLFDIVAALLGCLLLAPLIPIVWLANRITSPGDLFYRHERVGKGGKSFQIVKFRSMVMNADKTDDAFALWTADDDPRITPIGRFIRKTRIDELPQLWNVLKGDMSMIGPRPESIEVVRELERAIPYYRARHAVKPGLTGWAQVRYGYGNSIEDALAKLQYDLHYIKHQGPYLDLHILAQTVQVVLRMQGH
jgi:exopolysaccharide biosynthesis polyprenyl glycosylphosphotransferase